ncbi:MAG TPA: hypothetical protein VLA31_00795 [Burkholderiaceae bacterium]|nr:hypothetical protein [Burkholderiaceae bacterium]
MARGTDQRDWITVPQVARSMNVELKPREAWSIGSMIASMYQTRVGSLPTKALRPKSCGSGSHCFAIYPPSWEKEIRAAISAQVDGRPDQGALFWD